MAIILASASPRRQELLAQIGVTFQCLPMDINEDVLPNECATDYVKRLAEQKALACLPLAGDLPILGADTSVIIEDKILGKPVDAQDAKRLLRLLSGKTHQVLSGIAMVHKHNGQLNIVSKVVCTQVTFMPLTEQVINAYVATQEPMGKAGAYAIQGMAATLIERIDGSYSNVVGLPLMETSQLLQQFNVCVWQDKTPKNSN